jgi:AraC family transcriptional regulator, transcriptional activator of pobA
MISANEAMPRLSVPSRAPLASAPARPMASRAPAPDAVANYGFDDYGAKTRHFHVYPYDKTVDPRNLRHVPHRHDFYQIIWLRTGAGELECDLRRTRFRGDSLFFFAPGRMHSWRHEEATHGVMAGITPEFFNADGHNAGLLGRMPFLHDMPMPMIPLEGVAAREMDELFQGLLEESGGAEVGQEDIVRGWMTVILAKARQHLRRRQESEAAAGAASRAEAVHPLAQRFRLALERNFPKLLKVSDYAALLQVSRSHLNEDLRLHTGRTASDHIHDRLLLEAKRLLVYSSLTVAEIAYQLRFQDPSYFGRFFRQRTALAPGAFRAREQALLLNG